MEIDKMSEKGSLRIRVHIKRQQAHSINISKHPSRPTSITLSNLKIKCSIPPHIDRCVRIPKHVCLVYSSACGEAANSLFVHDKYVTNTGTRLHAGYVQKAEARKTHII